MLARAVCLLLVTVAAVTLAQGNPPACVEDASCSHICSYTRKNGITFMCLRDSNMRNNGIQYGRLMAGQLRDALETLHEHLDYEYANHYQATAEAFYERYSMTRYAPFLVGVAEGSGLSVADVNLLNAQVTYSRIKPFGCMFGHIPGSKTASGKPYILRNYDLPSPFGEIGEHLHVVVMADSPMVVPTAMIGMVGQIYCPSCLNANGIYLELNNGMPSGGWETNTAVRPSIMINMQLMLERATSFKKLQQMMHSASSDFSLILNAADAESGSFSMEYSSRGGSAAVSAPTTDVFVSTNYYQSREWGARATPTNDTTTWKGYLRHNQLTSSINALSNADMSAVQNLMHLDTETNGARDADTVWQTIYDTHSGQLAIRSIVRGDWWLLDMSSVFASAAHPPPPPHSAAQPTA